MIITRLAGGIGNQMFHYAAATSSRRSATERIILDTHELRPLETDIEKIAQRPYALDVFPDLQATVIGPGLRRMLHGDSILEKAGRRLFKLRTISVHQQFLEPVPIGPRRSSNLWLLGNFQSEEYFAGYRQQLLRDFTFAPMDAANEAAKSRILRSPEALCIHLRRGDYHSSRNKSIYDSVTLDYYHAALRKLSDWVPVKTLEAFVFSDDIPWAKANFNPRGLRLEFMDGNDARNGWKDMNLMTCCRHHIIANSSFSWWGAWLSERGGANFAPRHWFRPDTYPFDIEHIAPKAWHVVDYALQ